MYTRHERAAEIEPTSWFYLHRKFATKTKYTGRREILSARQAIVRVWVRNSFHHM